MQDEEALAACLAAGRRAPQCLAVYRGPTVFTPQQNIALAFIWAAGQGGAGSGAQKGAVPTANLQLASQASTGLHV